MALLCWARVLVAWVRFERWRDSLGLATEPAEPQAPTSRASFLVAAVERAARRLPFETKCLPRAMALSWMLRRERVPHDVVVAVRPANQRGSDDDLHAWIEVASAKILGDLPGPWVETFRTGDRAR